MYQKKTSTHIDLREVTRIANEPIKDSGYTRQFYSYPAKFQYRLPRHLIESLTTPGGLVVDPYVGGGTVALESLLLGRSFVGYDLNPLAVLIARVKTTRLAAETLLSQLETVLRRQSKAPATTYFDAIDIQCIGLDNASETARLAKNIKAIDDRRHRDFFLLALIHSLKIIGRRDYDEEDGDTTTNGKLELFTFTPESPIQLMFARKAKRMVGELQTLPKHHPATKIVLRSNHDMHEIADSSAFLIVTSPPYKDLDVEYALLQFQRPSLNRSKRSDVINRLLEEAEPPSKIELCGGRGDAYFANLRLSLREMHRILAAEHFAFFWTGFKTNDDRDQFLVECQNQGLTVVECIQVTLGDDRVASSRSTHHDRDTGMLSHDFLIVTRKTRH